MTLEVKSLSAGYGAARVLHGLDFAVAPGAILVILGANGAGKTTTLRSLTGMVAASGSVQLDGEDLLGLSTEKVASRRVAHVPQGRGTFGRLTVEENLRVGAYLRRGKGVAAQLDRWYTVFPRLAERRNQKAAGLSGGEQQMLAIARALMSDPRLLLLDEPSLGLAPNTTSELFSTLAAINREHRLTMVIVEQSAHLALQISTDTLLLESGRIVLRGSSGELAGNEDIRRAYLGY